MDERKMEDVKDMDVTEQAPQCWCSCQLCGGETVPAGSCHVCLNCGSTTGCS